MYDVSEGQEPRARDDRDTGRRRDLARALADLSDALLPQPRAGGRMDLVVQTPVLGHEAARQLWVCRVHDRPLVVGGDVEHVPLPRGYGLPVPPCVGEDFVLFPVWVDGVLWGELRLLEREEGLDGLEEGVGVGKVSVETEELVKQMTPGRKRVREHILDRLQVRVPLVILGVHSRQGGVE